MTRITRIDPIWAMTPTEITYFLIRLAEEQFGPPLNVGDVLVYRAKPRFGWFGENFDMEPGTVATVRSVSHDVADTPDHDPYDNHYFYQLDVLHHHGGICTTELIAFFDMRRLKEAFNEIAAQVRGVVANLTDETTR